MYVQRSDIYVDTHISIGRTPTTIHVCRYAHIKCWTTFPGYFTLSSILYHIVGVVFLKGWKLFREQTEWNEILVNVIFR